jgi:hypothetical protein
MKGVSSMQVDINAFVSTYNDFADQLTKLKRAVYAITHPELSIATEPIIVSIEPYGRSNYLAALSNGKTLNVNAFLSPLGGGFGTFNDCIVIWQKNLAALSYPTPMTWDAWFKKYVPKALKDVLHLRPEDVLYINHDPNDYSRWYDQDNVLQLTKLTKAMLWDYVQYAYASIDYESKKARGLYPFPIILPKPDFKPGSGYMTPWPFDNPANLLRGEQGNLVYQPLGV